MFWIRDRTVPQYARIWPTFIRSSGIVQTICFSPSSQVTLTSGR